jgi:hypothetical protein
MATDCQTCHWFKKQDDKGGNCRRFPPVPSIFNGKVVQMWPPVQLADGCGEHKDKRPAGNPAMEVI